VVSRAAATRRHRHGNHQRNDREPTHDPHSRVSSAAR
jgi:hypothetical protein